MIHLCKLVTDIKYDLDDYSREDFFRAYTTDLSLLLAREIDFLIQKDGDGNIGSSDNGIITLPLYMAAFI